MAWLCSAGLDWNIAFHCGHHALPTGVAPHWCIALRASTSGSLKVELLSPEHLMSQVFEFLRCSGWFAFLQNVNIQQNLDSRSWLAKK